MARFPSSMWGRVVVPTCTHLLLRRPRFFYLPLSRLFFDAVLAIATNAAITTTATVCCCQNRYRFSYSLSLTIKLFRFQFTTIWKLCQHTSDRRSYMEMYAARKKNEGKDEMKKELNGDSPICTEHTLCDGRRVCWICIPWLRWLSVVPASAICSKLNFNDDKFFVSYALLSTFFFLLAFFFIFFDFLRFDSLQYRLLVKYILYIFLFRSLFPSLSPQLFR